MNFLIRDELVGVSTKRFDPAQPQRGWDTDRITPGWSALEYQSVSWGVDVSSHRLGAVLECDSADVERWDAEVSSLREALNKAWEELYVSTGRPPKRRPALLHRWAHARWRRRVEAAAAAYRSTGEEIKTRLAAPEAKHLQARMQRFWEAGRQQSGSDSVRAGQVPPGRSLPDRDEQQELMRARLREVGEKAVWCWVVAKGEKTMRVYRNDAREASEVSGEGWHFTTPLTAAELEAELIRHRTRSIAWDPVSRLATVLECGLRSHHSDFDRWWTR